MAYVTPSFASGNKTRTRRDWTDRTRRLFIDTTRVLVWNKQARFGGEPIGVMEITDRPYTESTAKMTDADYYLEGFHYLDERYHQVHDEWPLKSVFRDWRKKDQILTVIDFRIIDVFPTVFNRYTTVDEIERCVKALTKALA